MIIPKEIRETIEAALHDSMGSRGAMTEQEYKRWEAMCEAALAWLEDRLPLAATMQGERQDVTAILSDRNGSYKEWIFRAAVFGVWAIHRPHEDEAMGDDYWLVSHAPTGVALLRIESHEIAILAAERLATIPAPAVTIKTFDDGRKLPILPPAEWIEQAASALAELGHWEKTGRYMSAPGPLVDAMRRIHEVHP